MENKKVKKVRNNAQTSNRSTKRKKVTKKYSPVFGDVWGHRAWKDGKLTDTIRDIIIKKMEEFLAGNEEWNSIPQFVAQLGLPYITYMKWAAEDKELKPIHAQFVTLLGAKRQPHAEWKKYGATETIKNTLYQYHPDYKRLREDDKKDKTDLKMAEAQNQAANIKVVLQDYSKVEENMSKPDSNNKKQCAKEHNVSEND